MTIIINISFPDEKNPLIIEKFGSIENFKEKIKEEALDVLEAFIS